MKIFIKIIQTKRKLFFKLNLKLSRDRNKRINHDFLNILNKFEKRLENYK